MRAEYPQIVRDFEASEFPLDFLGDLSGLLEQVGRRPLIVRSSSLLEDNFGTSFAGKYESVFCPNQGTHAANLRALTRAIIRVYTSTLNPNALLYRRSKGLQDYDERMAILIQVVEGKNLASIICRTLPAWPSAATCTAGRRRSAARMVLRAWCGVWEPAPWTGLGNDYPRLVALSHPLLRPSTDPTSIRRYSQQYVDLIDLEQNEFRTLPIHEVLDARYPPLRYLVQHRTGWLFRLAAQPDAGRRHEEPGPDF